MLVQVGKERRERWIFAIGFSYVLIIGKMIRLNWMHCAWESIQREKLP
jgi:hypothetical protein